MSEETDVQNAEKIAEKEPKKQGSADMQDVLTQLAADFENFRKDAARGMEEAERFGVRAFVLALAPALDSFTLALRSAEGKVEKQYVIGFQKVYEQLVGVFASAGVVKTPIEGSYDPKFHEAVERVAGEAYAIVEVVSDGWMWEDGGQVIVPAKVKVGDGSS